MLNPPSLFPACLHTAITPPWLMRVSSNCVCISALHAGDHDERIFLIRVRLTWPANLVEATHERTTRIKWTLSFGSCECVVYLDIVEV